MSIGHLYTPVAGNCLPYCWWNNLGACPQPMYIFEDAGFTIMAINFAGRGKVGPASGCGGSDTYVTFPTDYRALVDVWRAYRDGIWSSSTTISVYLGYPFSPANANIRATGGGFAGACPSVAKLLVPVDLLTCATVVRAIVTVNSNGTYSIA